MALSIGDFYRANLYWSMAGQACLTTFNFRSGANATIKSQVNAVLDGAINRIEGLANQWANIAHSSVLFTGIYIGTIAALFAPYEREKQLEITGQGSGDLLPGLCGVPLYLHTDFAGRSRRGRIHLGGFTEDDQSGGILGTNGRTKMDAFRTYYETQFLGSAQMRPIVFSRKIFQELPPNTSLVSLQEGVAGSPWAGITHTTYRPVIGTVYSRKPGRGA